MDVAPRPLLAATYPGALLVLLAVGLLGLFIFLAVLVWTRFGQARPISKCVVLSLLAHLLLLIYAYSTHVLFAQPGEFTGQTVRVRLRDVEDDEEAAPVAAAEPLPWEQPGEAKSPLAEAVADASTEPIAPTAPNPPPLLPDEPALEPPEEKIAPETIAADDSQPKQAPTEIPEVATSDAAAEPLPMPASPPPQETAATADPPPADNSTEFVAAAAQPPRRLGDGREVPQPLQARVAADRLQAATPFGATPRTEAAVAAALDWLAAAQSADGRWDADLHGGGRETRSLGHDRRGAGAQADTGVSGLALLAFLGAGETHLAGRHRENVQHGLEFLLASQAASGSLAGNSELFAAMYSHGIATLALSEAYALSGDERLLPGLRRALEYTIAAQHAGGGWRYQPHDAGDMSQFGWQLMALKSAELGGMPIPPATRARMIRFLQSCSSGRQQGLAAYRPGDRASRTMTAEALVCRYFLDALNSPPTLDEAAACVSGERPGIGQANYYYWYYGTLAMFQRQGDDWQRWNAALQRELLGRQRWDGAAAGSFDPDDLWGGYGGRVYSTAMAALSLEVYYRYTPLHAAGDDSRLTDRPWLPAVPR